MPIDLEPVEVDYEPLPYYMEPVESPITDTEYPLTYTGGRIPYFHHNTLRNIPWLREMYPAPEMWLCPGDAEKYGLEEGDWAWIESRRGRTRGLVKVTEGIKPGSVYMERFWLPENLDKDTHGFREMNVNMLTKASAPYNPEIGTYTLRAFQVKVYKAEGAPEGVWLEPESFKEWLPVADDRTKEVKAW